MSSPYYLGASPDESLGESPRYFYGIRRNNEGELFLVRSNQLIDTDAITINDPDAMSGTFDDFEAGVDYFEGVDEDHNIVYSGLKYTQYKWDERPIFYYIDDNGNLVLRINKGYTYPTGISSNG